MQQARSAMSVAFGGAGALPTRDIVPSAVYPIPEVAMAGDTEEAIHAAGGDYVVGRARYADNPRGCIIGEKEGFLKLIFRREDLKLLGACHWGTRERVGAHRADCDDCGLRCNRLR
jgi:NAD(P) transhydrogenase